MFGVPVIWRQENDAGIHKSENHTSHRSMGGQKINLFCYTFPLKSMIRLPRQILRRKTPRCVTLHAELLILRILPRKQKYSQDHFLVCYQGAQVASIHEREKIMVKNLVTRSLRLQNKYCTGIFAHFRINTALYAHVLTKRRVI